jgi:hypothetical protein
MKNGGTALVKKARHPWKNAPSGGMRTYKRAFFTTEGEAERDQKDF